MEEILVDENGYQQYLDEIETLGLGTATSTPDSVIKDVIDWLHDHGFETVK